MPEAPMRPLLTCLALAALALPLRADDRPAEADDVLALIGARAGETIADVGCGRGTWTFMLAQAVGPSGKVFAVDIDAKVLEAVDERIARESITNVQTRHS